MFVSFAASIHGHIGATEWLEHHLPKLKNRVVAYINLGAKYLCFFSLSVFIFQYLNDKIYNYVLFDIIVNFYYSRIEK